MIKASFFLKSHNRPQRHNRGIVVIILRGNKILNKTIIIIIYLFWNVILLTTIFNSKTTIKGTIWSIYLVYRDRIGSRKSGSIETRNRKRSSWHILQLAYLQEKIRLFLHNCRCKLRYLLIWQCKEGDIAAVSMYVYINDEFSLQYVFGLISLHLHTPLWTRSKWISKLRQLQGHASLKIIMILGRA